MPPPARKSSIGTARRGIQKAHIPYRGDNPEVGKKTGIAVAHVRRTSDGFEPFDQIIQQADKRTPPKPKKRKKSVPTIQQPELDDEDGEMSMDIVDTPMRYLSNAQIPSSPTLRNNSGSGSLRPVARSSDVDFDDIPSPRQRISISSSARARPSGLSNTFTASQSDTDSDNEPLDHGSNFDVSGATDLNGDLGPQDPPPRTPSPALRRSSPRRRSFAQIDQGFNSQEEEEEHRTEGQETEQSDEPPKVVKEKRKIRLKDVEDEDLEVEEEIAQGLHDLEIEQSEEEEQTPPPPPRKKQRIIEEQEKPKKNETRKQRKENRGSIPVHLTIAEPPRNGVRRSKRERYKPLEWWRGEKVVYGRTQSSGPILVPTIKEIIRIPIQKPLPLSHKRRGYSRARSKTADEKLTTVVHNPEEGWDDATDPFGEVYDLDKQALVVRRLAWTTNRLSLVKAANSDWLFEKVFGDSDFVAAGQLLIPPECRKPTKATKDNTYIFYVIEGAVNFKVHEVSKVVATGGMFIAPRGNTYFIENISTRAAKLFFTQARKVPKDAMDPPGNSTQQRKEKKRSLDEVRTSSPRSRSSTAGGRSTQSLPPQPSQTRPVKAGKRAPLSKALS